MKGKLMFVPDTHMVVPKEPTHEMLEEIKFHDYITDSAMSARYRDLLEKSPPLPTPPVLRWEGATLKLGNHSIIYAWDIVDGRFIENEQEARRAAEKALGIPFEVEEV